MMSCLRIGSHGGEGFTSLLIFLFLVFFNVILLSEGFTIGSITSSFTQHTKLYQRQSPSKSERTATRNTHLNMMFDQLSAALTDVTKNFGKKR